MSSNSLNLDQDLDSIIKKSKKKNGAANGKQKGNQTKKAQGKSTPTKILSKRTSIRTARPAVTTAAGLTRQREATAKAARNARSQSINKARGIQSQTTKTVARRRASINRTNTAHNLVRKALLRTHHQQGARRPLRISQRANQARANNNTSTVQTRNLRITVTNSNRDGQGARNGGTSLGRLRAPNGNLRSQQGLRSRTTLALRNPLQGRISQRARTNIRRAPTQNLQRQPVSARLSRVRATNQARQANVVAQRRGLRTTPVDTRNNRNYNNNRNNFSNDPYKNFNNNRNSVRSTRNIPRSNNTLDARFSQQRRSNAPQGSARQVRSVAFGGNQYSNNNRLRGNQQRYSNAGPRRLQRY